MLPILIAIIYYYSYLVSRNELAIQFIFLFALFLQELFRDFVIGNQVLKKCFLGIVETKVSVTFLYVCMFIV